MSRILDCILDTVIGQIGRLIEEVNSSADLNSTMHKKLPHFQRKYR